MFKKCEICGVEFKIKPSHYNLRKTCSRKCGGELYKVNFSGSNNPAFGKTYNTKKANPDWAKNIQAGTKGKINLGDSNPMKRQEVRTKMAASRSKMLENPEVRKAISVKTKEAWAAGKYDGVRVGQCKWYSYTLSNGTIVKVQGTWELAFVKWADEGKLELKVHKQRIPYVDKDGSQRSYYPDFFVEQWNCWVDVKNDYHYSLQREKFHFIRQSNPNINLRILRKNDLLKLGVEIK